MNRNETLRRLFQAYRDDTFKAVAKEIIDDERRCNNNVLADELEKMLSDKEYALAYLRKFK